MRLETQITDIKKDIATHTEHQRQDFEKLYKKLDTLNDNFAGKWVEKVSVGVLITVIAGLLLYIVQIV